MPAKPSAVRVVALISGAGRAWRYTMYLEIHRWKHVSRSFRFIRDLRYPAPPSDPGPAFRCGRLFVCSAVAPTVFARRRPDGVRRRRGHRRGGPRRPVAAG